MMAAVLTGPDGARASAYDRRWIILAVVLAAECMDLLDATIVNVAAPSIRDDLGASSTALQWIVGGYALSIAVGLTTGGRLGDFYGRRQMFVVGSAGFTAASVLCGLAPTTGTLIAARLLQGVAAAVMLPQGLGVLREVFPADEIQKAFAVFGPVIGSAAVFGPVVGGGLIDLDLAGTGWRLVFFVNLPLGLAAVIGAWLMLPRTAAPHDGARLDIVGAALSCLAAFSLIYPLIQGRELGWPAWCYVLIAGGVVLFGVFGFQQRGRSRAGADPLVLPALFAKRSFVAGVLVLLVFFAGMSGVLFTSSVFLQLGHGFTPIHAGLTFMPLSVGLAVGSGLSGGWLGPKYGRPVLQAGAVVTAIGTVLLALAVDDSGSVGSFDLLPGFAVAGLGMGLLVAPMFGFILAAVSDEETGSASGVTNAIQQLAGAVGVAVLGTIFFSRLENSGFAGALDDTLWVQAGSLGVLLAVTPLLPRYAREESDLFETEAAGMTGSSVS